MTKQLKTPPDITLLASKILQNPKSSSAARRVACAALTQSREHTPTREGDDLPLLFRPISADNILDFLPHPSGEYLIAHGDNGRVYKLKHPDSCKPLLAQTHTSETDVILLMSNKQDEVAWSFANVKEAYFNVHHVIFSVTLKLLTMQAVANRVHQV